MLDDFSIKLHAHVAHHGKIWHKFQIDYVIKTRIETFFIITQYQNIRWLIFLGYLLKLSSIWDAVEVVLKQTQFVKTVWCKWKMETKQGTMTATKEREMASKGAYDSVKESVRGNWKGLRDFWDSEGLRGSWEGLKHVGGHQLQLRGPQMQLKGPQRQLKEPQRQLKGP